MSWHHIKSYHWNWLISCLCIIVFPFHHLVCLHCYTCIISCLDMTSWSFQTSACDVPYHSLLKVFPLFWISYNPRSKVIFNTSFCSIIDNFWFFTNVSSILSLGMLTHCPQMSWASFYLSQSIKQEMGLRSYELWYEQGYYLEWALSLQVYPSYSFVVFQLKITWLP